MLLNSLSRRLRACLSIKKVRRGIERDCGMVRGDLNPLSPFKSLVTIDVHNKGYN